MVNRKLVYISQVFTIVVPSSNIECVILNHGVIVSRPRFCYIPAAQLSGRLQSRVHDGIRKKCNAYLLVALHLFYIYILLLLILLLPFLIIYIIFRSIINVNLYIYIYIMGETLGGTGRMYPLKI